MTTRWVEGEDWDRLSRRLQRQSQRSFRPTVADLPVKAATGPGVVALTYDIPLFNIAENPQRKAREALKAYRTHAWVNTAERSVSGVAANVPWHLEDDDGETVVPEMGPVHKAVLRLMNNPMPKMRLSRRQVWRLTLRHAGLAGYTFWYLDERELLADTPASAYYIRPDRMLPATNKTGELIGWIMDGDRPDGRQPVAFTPEEIIVFTPDPDDDGVLGIGLVEAAWRKLQLEATVGRHTEKMIASGGRLAGMISPTAEKGSFNQDEYDQIVRELRNVTDSPEAAKKALIFKVPVDFKATAASPSQMNLPDLNRMGRDDIFAIWNLPLSEVGVSTTRALNSGEAQKYEEAVAWQKAREPRLAAFGEALQTGLLDRYQALGVNLTLKLETPTFDDQLPLYQVAEKAKTVPLTVNQRLALVGADPLDEETYGALGTAIYIDQSMVPVFLPATTNVEEPEPSSSPLTDEGPGKASLSLRSRTEVTWEPRLRSTISKFLAKQRDFLASRIEEKAGHLRKEPKDISSWWNGLRWDRELREALLADEERMASGVRSQVAKTLKAPGKADPLDTLLTFIRERVGERITGINDTTRDDIARLVEDGVEAGLSPAELGANIRDATAFNEARAEMISRTETMLAYNDAALRTYQDYRVEEVEAIDGDGDAECAARNGKRYPVDEAYGITDHPNGTLDWIPVTPGKANEDSDVKPEDLAAIQRTIIEAMGVAGKAGIPWGPGPVSPVTIHLPSSLDVQMPPPQVNVTVPTQPAPTVNVRVPEQKAPVVNFTPPKVPAKATADGPMQVQIVGMPARVKQAKRDRKGQTEGTIEVDG